MSGKFAETSLIRQKAYSQAHALAHCQRTLYNCLYKVVLSRTCGILHGTHSTHVAQPLRAVDVVVGYLSLLGQVV